MYALDEALNARDWDAFDLFYDPSAASSSGQTGSPVPPRGGQENRAESIRFCTASPDNRIRWPTLSISGALLSHVPSHKAKTSHARCREGRPGGSRHALHREPTN